MKIPEGWKLVPVEPTEEMRRAYYACVPDRTGPIHAATQKWNAMLAAAPTPPASTAWPRECEELCKAAEQFQHAVNELCKAENPDDLQNGDTAMSEEEARKNPRAVPVYTAHKKNSDPTPPAQEAEPVAYYGARCHGYFQDVLIRTTDDLGSYREAGFTLIPLYTRPDGSGLRKAAEEVVKISFEKDVIVSLQGFIQAIENLRAALEGK